MITHSEQWRNPQVSKLAFRRKSLRLHVNRQFVYWRHPALVFLRSYFIKTKHFVLQTGWEITQQTKAKSGISSDEFLLQLMCFKVFQWIQHHIKEAANCTVLFGCTVFMPTFIPGCTATNHFLLLQLQKHADCHFKNWPTDTNKASPHDSILNRVSSLSFFFFSTGELLLSFLFFLSSILT